MSKLCIGFVCIGRFSFDIKYAHKLAKEASKQLQTLDYDWVIFEEIVEIENQAYQLVSELKTKKVDLLITMYGTFGLGTLSQIFTELKDVPIILWGIPEPSLHENKFRLNSFCAINLNAYTLKRLGHQYSYIYDDIEKGIIKLKSLCRVYSSLKKLRTLRVGQFGSSAPGFTPCLCDEINLKMKLGSVIHHVSLLELDFVAKQAIETDIKCLASEIHDQSDNCVVTEDEINHSARYFHALLKLVEQYKLDCVAVKNWPELPVISDVMLGAVYSCLTTRGLMCAVEGDIYGVISMVLAFELSGIPPFFADLVSLDQNENTVLFWHGGSAPLQWAKDRKDVKLLRHMGAGGGDKIGTTREFRIVGDGTVTIMRLGECNSGLRMFVTRGTMQLDCPYIRGTPMKIRMETQLDLLTGVIMGEGLEHHYIIIAGDYLDDVVMVGKHLNAQIIKC